MKKVIAGIVTVVLIVASLIYIKSSSNCSSVCKTMCAETYTITTSSVSAVSDSIK